jgi:hypothetical protein
MFGKLHDVLEKIQESIKKSQNSQFSAILAEIGSIVQQTLEGFRNDPPGVLSKLICRKLQPFRQIKEAKAIIAILATNNGPIDRYEALAGVYDPDAECFEKFSRRSTRLID